MKRPEKKERNPNIFALYDTDIVKESHAVGYNQAIDDMDKFEPTVEEIEEIIDRNMSERSHVTKDDQYSGLVVHPNIHLVKDTAQAIHKRLRGE